MNYIIGYFVSRKGKRSEGVSIYVVLFSFNLYKNGGLQIVPCGEYA